MKFEDLIDKSLHEMSDDEIDELIKTLSAEQLQIVERKIKQKLRKKPVTTKAKKAREDELNKALLGIID